MAGAGSLAVFLTTVFFLGFDGFWTDIFQMKHVFQNRGRINYLGIIAIFNMDPNSSLIIVLEEKIIGLLNKLKENHLSLFKEEELRMNLLKKNKSLEERVVHLQNENKSLKIANNLLGSNEGKSQAKTKINSLIKEVDYCIQQFTEIN